MFLSGLQLVFSNGRVSDLIETPASPETDAMYSIQINQDKPIKFIALKTFWNIYIEGITLYDEDLNIILDHDWIDDHPDTLWGPITPIPSGYQVIGMKCNASSKYESQSYISYLDFTIAPIHTTD